jgi:hypothetical protein
MTDLYTKFTEFEKTNSLLIDNPYAYVWEGLRFGVFRTLVTEMHQTKKAQDQLASPRESVSGLIKHLLRLSREYIGTKPSVSLGLMRYQDREYCFWGHPRRKLEPDGFYWDIYVDPLLEQVKPNSYVVFESKILGAHRKPAKTKVLLYPDYIDFELTVFRLFSRKKNRLEKMVAYFAGIEAKLLDTFGIHIDIVRRARHYEKFYEFQRRQYRKILRQVNPKVLMIVVGYGKEILVRAAKDLHIPVVELQHGVLSKYHLGYDVSSGRKENFADYFFSFGPAWGNMAHFPIPPERIIPIGYQYLNTAAKKYQKVEKKNQILFLSQGTIGDRLSDFAVELAKIIPADIRVIYKLHPGEIMRWKTEYQSLLQAFEQGLIDVITGDEPSLYQLMAQSKWQVGVNSTALFEGMIFKCRTYIVDLPGIEYVEALIDNNEFILVQKPEQIEFTYDRDELNYRTEEYFSQDTETKFKAAVDFVMKDYYA